MNFEVSSVSAGTTRTLTVPNASGTLALLTSAWITLGPWVQNDVPATATTERKLPFMSSATAWVQGAANFNDFVMPAAGVVVGAFLNADAARTAGTATLRLRVNAVDTPFAGGAVALDAANTIRDSAMDFTGVTLAAGDRIGVNVTTAGWAPTTGDVQARLVVRLNTT